MTTSSTSDHPDVDTAATRAIAALGIAHEIRVIERPRSLKEAAERLGVTPDRVLKTMVVRRGEDDYLLALVPGTRQIDWPRLRAHLGVNRLSMPDAEVARAATGYERGTITPFGTARTWPVIADASIASAGTITVGGGAHGVSLRLDANDLVAAVNAELAEITEPA